MTKVLIVYEEIPEKTTFYRVEVGAEDLAWMTKCHGAYVNACIPGSKAVVKEINGALEKMSLYLEDKEKLEVKPGVPLEVVGVELVIHTGFIL